MTHELGTTHLDLSTRTGVDSTPAGATGVVVPRGGERHDRIRWSAAWTGAVTTITVFITLQLLFFSLGWLDFGFDGDDTAVARAVTSGALALVAFFIGGLAAGASALWTRASDGMVNGVVAWAVAVLTLLGLALLGGGALLGSLADTVSQFTNLQRINPNINVGAATDTARDTAGWTAFGLGLSALTAAIGGAIGAKIWPGKSSSSRTS